MRDKNSKYVDEVHKKPTPNATLETAVWWKKNSEINWYVGRLILLDQNIILKTYEEELFNEPASSISIEYINPTDGFVLTFKHNEDGYWIRFMPKLSLVSIFSIRRMVDAYTDWDNAIYNLTGNRFLHQSYNKVINIYYKILYLLAGITILFVIFIYIYTENI